jgi:Fic family protein
MKQFLEWFARTRKDGEQPLSALTRAAISHLYFESVHPFEDGNGRIGRSIAEKSLAESLGQPTLITLAATILLRRKAYYEALEAANKHNEITNWVAWFAGITRTSCGIGAGRSVRKPGDLCRRPRSSFSFRSSLRSMRFDTDRSSPG